MASSLLQRLRTRRLLPVLFLTTVATFGLLSLLLGTRDASFVGYYYDRWRGGGGSATTGSSTGPPLARHPIDDLIRDARLEFKLLMGKRSLTVEQAAARYRERRGRHPPPGFDKWFAVAMEKEAIIVEEFFDRIYHDINPFWGLEPREIRARAHAQPYLVRVRNGQVGAVTDEKEEHFRLKQFKKLVQEIPYLPDLDIYINHMDESRVMVPWDDVARYVAAEEANRTLIHPTEAITTYSGVADVEANERYDPGWLHDDSHKFWDYVRAACPPGSPSRNVPALPSFDGPVEYPTGPVPEYTQDGYIRNFTASMDPCLQPHLRGMHGTFVEAISMATTTQLMPLFGECKLTTNNDILIPAAIYLAEDERADYSGGNDTGGPWAEKTNGLVWRGAASGLRNKRDNWWHNHRHRFVQMLNGTTVSALEAGDTFAAPTFRLPPLNSTTSPYNNTTLPPQGHLGPWLTAIASVGFTTMVCYPPEHDPTTGTYLKSCSHTDAYLALAEGMPFARAYRWKYLPDVDGNTFSGRYRAFLRSSSLPLKATAYAEWHDARLRAWVHFVPVDNSYGDVYGVMGYFLGGDGIGEGHDAEAERMAREGQEWAMRVLRREDMMLYTWRLLLEYARVMDEERDRLAYVEDLVVELGRANSGTVRWRYLGT